MTNEKRKLLDQRAIDMSRDQQVLRGETIGNCRNRYWYLSGELPMGAKLFTAYGVAGEIVYMLDDRDRPILVYEVVDSSD